MSQEADLRDALDNINDLRPIPESLRKVFLDLIHIAHDEIASDIRSEPRWWGSKAREAYEYLAADPEDIQDP